MSLKVWLPLNGNLNNQGLSDITVTNNGATVNNSGKIGQCYSFSSSYITYSGFDASGLEELSVCFWAYPTNTNLGNLFGMNTTTNYLEFSIANSGKLYVRDSSTGATGTANQYEFGTIEANKWIHVTITYNRGTVKIYKDGVLESTNTTGGSYLTSGIAAYNIGRSYSTNYYSGKINDFRVYDNCLSPKEISDISKGLILHYTLDYDNSEEGLINDCSGYGYNSDINGTISVISSESSPRYKNCTSFSNGAYLQCTINSTEVRTVSFWCKWNSIGSASQVVFCDYGSRFGFGLSNSGLLCTCNNVYSKFFSKTDITTGTWYHFTLVNTGSSNTDTTRDLYINGVKQTPLTNTSYWTYPNNYLNIGNRNNSTSYYFDGFLSDFRMYSTALSEQDILDLYSTSAYIDNQANQYCYELDEQSENLFTTENLQKYRISTSSGSGEWTTRNGIPAIALNPTRFYQNSDYIQVLKDEFKPNTQYLFDMWIDNDDVISNNTQQRGGIMVYYTDTTTNLSSLTFIGGSMGFVHKRLITPANKSVSCIKIYYGTGAKSYYRYDSTITEYKDVDITKIGIAECSQVKEDANRENNAFVKGGIIETKELKEI